MKEKIDQQFGTVPTMVIEGGGNQKETYPQGVPRVVSLPPNHGLSVEVQWAADSDVESGTRTKPSIIIEAQPSGEVAEKSENMLSFHMSALSKKPATTFRALGRHGHRGAGFRTLSIWSYRTDYKIIVRSMSELPELNKANFGEGFCGSELLYTRQAATLFLSMKYPSAPGSSEKASAFVSTLGGGNFREIDVDSGGVTSLPVGGGDTAELIRVRCGSGKPVNVRIEVV